MSNKLDAKTAHIRLREALAVIREAERNAVTLFAEIMRRRLYRELGYASIQIYAIEALGFSRSKTYEFIRLAESFDKLPALKGSLDSGRLSWTKAREVVKVATPQTVRHWIQIAENKSRRELEVQIVRSRALRDSARRDPKQGDLLEAFAAGDVAQVGAKQPPPAAAPVQALSLRLGPMQRARFDALVEKLMKRCGESREEIMLMAMEAMLAIDEKSTRVDGGAPYQVHVYRCESCAKSAVGAERIALDAAESAQVACDSEVLAPGKRSRRSIPPSRRRAVLHRDGHRCRVRGCDRASFLEVHHRKPLSEGGGNGEGNLVTLCSNCHRHVHEVGGIRLRLRDP